MIAVPEALNEGRRRNMRANRRTGTQPEVALRSALHARGYRFRKDLRIKAGEVWARPDVVFTRQKVAVFVDGCFWHACPEHGRPPKRNEWYWDPKLAGNVARDRRQDAALSDAGWRVLRLWEHEPVDAAVTLVVQALGGSFC